MSALNFNNIWVKQLDDGWLSIHDGRRKLATAWDLRSVKIFVGRYKEKRTKEIYANRKSRA